MRVSAVLLSCLACTMALPAYFFAYDKGRQLSKRKSVLDCVSPFPGFPLPERCRRRGLNQMLRSLRRPGVTPLGRPLLAPLPHRPHALTVLEIVEDELEEPRVVQVIEEDVESPFAISVPVRRVVKRRCDSNEVYISELDLCEDIDDIEESIPERLQQHPQQQQQQQHPEDFEIEQVGSYEKEKCSSSEIWVPEVGICMDMNPPAPLSPL